MKAKFTTKTLFNVEFQEVKHPEQLKVDIKKELKEHFKSFKTHGVLTENEYRLLCDRCGEVAYLLLKKEVKYIEHACSQVLKENQQGLFSRIATSCGAWIFVSLMLCLIIAPIFQVLFIPSIMLLIFLSLLSLKCIDFFSN